MPGSLGGAGRGGGGHPPPHLSPLLLQFSSLVPPSPPILFSLLPTRCGASSHPHTGRPQSLSTITHHQEKLELAVHGHYGALRCSKATCTRSQRWWVIASGSQICVMAVLVGAAVATLRRHPPTTAAIPTRPPPPLSLRLWSCACQWPPTTDPPAPHCTAAAPINRLASISNWRPQV